MKSDFLGKKLSVDKNIKSHDISNNLMLPQNFKEIYKYLKNEKFSNGLKVIYSGLSQYSSLQEFISTYFDGKKVLHIGFADHKDIVEEKIKTNRWIHSYIYKVGSEVWGVDIDCEAVTFIKNKYNIKNIICGDVEKYEDLPDDIKSKIWDYIVIFDVVEHIENPIKFLKSVSRIKSEYYVVSTPNAYRWENIIQAFNNMEIVNSDHKYWFSGYTLMKILTLAGFRVEKLLFLDRYEKNYSKMFSNPIFRDTVVAIVRPELDDEAL